MRIISLVPSITETLFELGLDKEIIAVTTFCRFPEAKVAEKLKIGGTKNPDREKILLLRPDLILLNEEENRKEDADFFRFHGIRLKITFPSNVVEAAQIVNDLGKELNKREKAESIYGQIIETFKRIQPPHQFRTLIFIWKRPYWTVNKTTYVDSICGTFGLSNVFGQSTERYPQLSNDQINQANPEVVLFPDEPYVFRSKDVEEFQTHFPELIAVRKQKLIMLDGTLLTWHGFRTLKALQRLPDILQQAGLWN